MKKEYNFSVSVSRLKWRGTPFCYTVQSMQGVFPVLLSQFTSVTYPRQLRKLYSHHRSRISFSFIMSLFIVFCCSINCWVSRRISPPVKNPETLLTRLCSMKFNSSSCFLFPAWRGQLHNLKSTTWQYLSVCPTTANGIRLQVNTPRKRNHVRRSMSWIKLFRNWGLWKVNVIHSSLGEWPTVFGRLFVLVWLTAVGLNSVGRVLDCKAGGRRFNSRGWTNTQGVRITEQWRYCLCPANG